jgi:group I intron endonuclease
MQEKMFYVYKIINKINNKVYIGKSINPTKRFKAHINLAKNHKGKYECTKLYRSMRKYGFENFELEVIQSFQIEKDSYDAEIKYIILYKSIENGLNIKPGGNGGSAGGKNHPMWGKKFSEESKNKMSISHIGIKDSEETKKLKSISHSGEKSHFAKLNNENVKIIKDELNNGSTITELAKRFNVTSTTIYYIKSGKTWK